MVQKRDSKGKFLKSSAKKVVKKTKATDKKIEKVIPPCPPKNDMDGDKTPEVVAWYKEYKPEEYKQKYHALELAKQGRLKKEK